MAKKPKLLSDLFHDTLKDVYFAEKKILTTLPKMAKAAQSRELKAAFLKHERETRGQVKRLEQVFKIFGKKPRAKKCEAIMGITKEGAEIMTEYKGMPALDAGLARRPSCRTLRDFPLRHAEDVGHRTGLARRRGSPRRDLKGREGHRPRTNRAGEVCCECRSGS